jgi:site-specific DNA-methyltransferase (adenine-specific)
LIDLRLGDCLEVMPTIPSGSVDLLLTDPPYFLPAKHYCTRKDFPRSLGDLSILEHFYRDFFAECARVIKPTGFLYVFCDGQSYPVFYVTAYRHVRKLVPLIWDKMNSINGFSWRHQHEIILFAEMDESPAVPTGDGDIIQCRPVPVDARIHPAEKPVKLLRQLIRKSAPEGGVVLDPFAGSGAVGEAAYLEGRDFIGVEASPEYYAEAQKRLAGLEEQKQSVGFDEVPLLSGATL